MRVKEKWTPEYVLIPSKGMRFVNRASIWPPGTHPSWSPLAEGCYAVELETAEGSRWWGFPEARIDSFLKVRVCGFSPKNELVMAWEDAQPEG